MNSNLTERIAEETRRGPYKSFKIGDDTITVKSNNATVKEICPLCGDLHKDADQPLWFFCDDRAVCANCIERGAPEEYQFLKGVLAAYWMVTNGKGFGVLYGPSGMPF